jgi:aminoglycoside phosphotransferase (APT) family kinase protein
VAVPTEADAIAIVRAALGEAPRRAQRFRHGLAHYVFDVDCGESRVVARLGRPGERFAATAAWHRRLKDVGVPVPDVLAAGEEPFPYLLLERLRGTDLGDVYVTLTDGEKRRIADEIAAAQACAATLKPLPGYGYARGYDDPVLHETWPAVIDARLDRSRVRGAQSGAFDLTLVERVRAAARLCRTELEHVEAMAYLEDATTKNVLVHDGRLTGIVDFDWVASGDVLMNVALTRVSLLAAGMDPSVYIETLLDALALERPRRLELYEAVFAIDLLAEMGTRFNRDEPVPVSRVRRRALTEIAETALTALRA